MQSTPDQLNKAIDSILAPIARDYIWNEKITCKRIKSSIRFDIGAYIHVMGSKVCGTRAQREAHTFLYRFVKFNFTEMNKN